LCRGNTYEEVYRNTESVRKVKRVITPQDSPQTLEINIQVNHTANIEATVINPVSVDDTLDDSAMSDYQVFIENLWSTISYYGFQLLKIKESKSFPYTSKYVWLAYAHDVKSGSIPLLIKLRVSDHIQNFSKQRKMELARQTRQEADQLKQPTMKKTQKYKAQEIIVNNRQFSTYEEALNAADAMIHKWLEMMNVDVSEYEEPLGEW